MRSTVLPNSTRISFSDNASSCLQSFHTQSSAAGELMDAHAYWHCIGMHAFGRPMFTAQPRPFRAECHAPPARHPISQARRSSYPIPAKARSMSSPAALLCVCNSCIRRTTFSLGGVQPIEATVSPKSCRISSTPEQNLRWAGGGRWWLLATNPPHAFAL